MQWDVFCHVVDNFGDVGVCWRLSADLASRGEQVRLWVDDPSPLVWIAPAGSPGVEVRAWDDAQAEDRLGDVVVEAFGCTLPEAFVRRMVSRTPAPVWINLEHLSAESFVERSHGLPSPQLAGPGQGLVKWFFYPGFTPGTGGLIREPGLLEAQRQFEPSDWLQRHGVASHHGERRISLFCYDNPALPALLDELAASPTLLIATDGLAARQVQRELGPSMARGALRASLLPPLTQTDFDRLLWACDLNLVRGEDSFVRAQWAGQPFVWHIYPQPDGAHHLKLDAFLDRFLHTSEPRLASHVRHCWRVWNGISPGPIDGLCLDTLARWQQCTRTWRDSLLLQPDLTQQLLRFVAERR